MEGHPLLPGGNDITWPDQVAPRGRKASSTRKIKPQTSNLKDGFLEAAAETYPRLPGDTRHGLHAPLAVHCWKHRHTITLHPLDHNPHRWTPEDDNTAAITGQQSPENPEEYHITWNDPAPKPPPPPPS